MLFRLRYALPLLLPFSTALAQTPTPAVRAQLPLRTVTVALNQAELEHRGTLNLPAGRSTVWVEGVARELNPASLQVETSDNAQLLSVSSETATAAPSTTPTDSLNLLDARLRRLDAEVKALEEERAFLLSNRTLPTGMQAGWSAELQKGAALLRTRLPDIQTQIETLGGRRQALAKRRERLAGDNAEPGRLRMALLLELPRSGTVALTLRYVNGNCSWEPEPEIRVPATVRKLDVVTAARVGNGSGVDWTGVQLRLKNEEVEANVTRPDLTPWAMNFRRSTGGEGRVDKFVVKGKANGGQVAAEPSSVYVVPEPVSIAKNDDYLVRLPVQSLSARPEFLAVPKLSEKVFLQAKVAGWEKLYLPAEEFDANVYYGGAYVGTTEIDPRAYNDSLEISLGHDNLIVLGRTKTEDFNAKASPNGPRRTRVTYQINLRNRHAETVRVRCSTRFRCRRKAT